MNSRSRVSRAAATWLAAAAILTTGCIHRLPLPERLKVNDTAELVARMKQNQSPVSRYLAELRVTYFGPEGRMRTTGTIAVSRPASLRCEMNGPHGAVVSAFATNGVELQALDVASSRFLYGPATAQNLDRLLPFAPLGLSANAWVKLLFGEIDIPSNAALSYDETRGHFVLRWRDNGNDNEVAIDPATTRLVQALVFSGATLVSAVHIEERDPKGLPVRLNVEAPQARIDLQAVLRDIEADGDIDASAFVLDPPTGIVPEHL